MTRKPMDRFEDEWKEWAERPPETPPARAAEEVLERLAEPRFPSRRGVRWLAAALVLTAVGVWYLAPPPLDIPETVETVEIPPLEEGVVLFWLDPQTPLYMTWQPPTAEKGNDS